MSLWSDLFSSSSSSGSSWMSSMDINANGGVYASPGLSAYSGQVVSRPTLFPFTKGVGLMSEAGPEAIMPLSRGAAGKLGIKAAGNSGDVNISIVVNSTDGTADQKATGDDQGAWTQFAGRIKGMIIDEMTTQKRPGDCYMARAHSLQFVKDGLSSLGVLAIVN